MERRTFHLFVGTWKRATSAGGAARASRPPSSCRCASKRCSSTMRARRCCATSRAAPRRSHAGAGRVRKPAHLRRVRVPHQRRARRARIAALGGRLPQRRHREKPARARSSCSTIRDALHDTQRYYARPSGRRALHDAVAGDQPRRRVGESQHAAHRQGVSARLGLDQLAAVGHSGLARYVVVRPRLRLLLAASSAATRSRSSTVRSNRAG